MALRTATTLAAGRIIATVLQGAWRPSPPQPAYSDQELAKAVPFLLAGGCGALAWNGLRHSSLSSSTSASKLRQAMRAIAARNLRYEDRLAKLLPALERARVGFVLIKGWALAPLYAGPELRPFGDIDLCVAPGEFDAAHQIVGNTCDLDLQAGLRDLPDRSWDIVLQHSRLASLRGEPVRVLGAEDQLRHLCLHQARHGCWRPLWLCDVAAALENIGVDFDWNYCLAGDRRMTAWVLSIISSAQQFFGANTKQPVPFELSPNAWLQEEILASWGASRSGDSHTRDDHPLVHSLARPWRLGTALARRWPNRIEGLFKARGFPDSRWPSILLQSLVYGNRILRFATARRATQK